ncbi:phosphoethanolamine transferase [Vibrio coralliilyticus]|uniref:phosphoethanolamine transferase n=1 Tax=Vibrio coralliilyticus TaxID=190893 RepID=UPI001E3D827F|nr:phosphoethanolamine transferase [Vibrio coralliilyticus]MCC2521692.1 phosphoethanolamine transferase [Vibrio coralliilyticus]
MKAMNKTAVVYCVVGLLPFLVPLVFTMQLSSVFTYYFALMSVLLLLLIMTFKGWLGKAIKLLFALSCLFSIVSLVLTGGLVSTGAFHSILLTHSEEVIGYFELVNWYIMVPVFLSTAIGLYCFWKAYLPIQGWRRMTLLLSVLAVATALPVFKWNFDPEAKQQITEDYVHTLYLYQDTPAYNIFRVAALAFYERYQSHLSYGQDLPEHVLPDFSLDIPTNIVIVIGESSRRASYSLYGSQINSSPRLKARYIEDSNLVTVVDGVFAPAPNTRESVPRSFSFISANQMLYQGLPYVNLIDVARMMGYQTTWVTTQALYTRWDSFTAKVATSSDNVIHTGEPGQLWRDIDAAKAVVKQLNKDDGHQFVVLHLSGEHADYSVRNGEALPQAHFDAIKQQLTLASGVSPIEIAYLSSVHFTDSILDALISGLFKDEPNSLLVYFSDHGEVIGKGHGLQPIRIEDELAVPYLVFGSLGKNMSEVINCYRDNQHLLFNSAYFPEVLLSTLGMKIEPPESTSEFTYYSVQGVTKTLPSDFSFEFYYPGQQQCRYNAH